MKKFGDAGVVTDIERHVHYRSAKNIATVSKNVAEDQNVSIARRS